MERSTPHTLRELFLTLGAHHLVRSNEMDLDVEILFVSDDSRKMRPGGLFVAVSGTEADGHDFISDAIGRGASAVVVEKHQGRDTGVPCLEVSNSRRVLAFLSHEIAGRPSHRLRLVGVTGTNGKTTTAWLIHHLLTKVGCETGLLGTIESRIGRRRTVASLTTPGPVELAATLSEMVEAGCTDCVMEVSSHALAQHRVGGLRFTAAVFTNLTLDHLDYHGTFDAYFSAKKSLFDGLETDGDAVYNADDPAGESIVADTRAACHAYGTRPEADISFRIVGSDLSGLHLNIDGDERSYKLVGSFNAYNLTAAYGLARAYGFDRPTVLEALASAPPVPGRIEQIPFSSGVTAIVDYAHTPDALKNVLAAVRDVSGSGAMLWCVFGCGGDRDRGKRPLMGRIAEHLADRVVITSDNPRTEAPEAIMDEIRAGMEHPERAAWISDRRQAIRYAAENAEPGDTVLIAGKGHENYQVIGRDRIHFDDREEVRRWFS